MATKTKAKGILRRGEDPITIDDVRMAGRQAAALLEIVDSSERELAEVGLTRREVRELEKAAKLATFRMPSARAFMLAALGNGMTQDVVLANYHRAVRAVHGMAPFVAWKLADKLDDENAPGSTRVLLEVAKGIGLLAPAQAQSSEQRLADLDFESLKQRAKKDPAALKAEILGAST